jgi:hypothetical protein
MMTIICCKTLCEFLLDLSAPERTTPVAATATTVATATVASVKAAVPTIIEMPILIRIYLPQQQPQQPQEQSQPSDAAHTKTSFDPLPV